MIVNVKEEWIKPIANISFFLFLSALTIYGLIHITNNIILRVVIGFIAFILDAYMLFGLSKAKYLWKTGLSKDKLIALKYFIVYAIYTVIYVFLFAVGFYLAELKTNTEIAQINQQIQSLQLGQINVKQTQAKALAEGLSKEVQTSYGKKSANLDQSITKLTEENEETIKTLQENSKRNAEASHNFIQSLVSTFDWDLNKLLALLFGVLVGLMQFVLIDSSFTIQLDNNGKVKSLDDTKKDQLRFLDALFDGRNGLALNGVNTIAEKLDWSIDKCMQMRTYFSQLKVNGGMAISVDQGASKANYSKDFIRNFIINH